MYEATIYAALSQESSGRGPEHVARWRGVTRSKECGGTHEFGQKTCHIWFHAGRSRAAMRGTISQEGRRTTHNNTGDLIGKPVRETAQWLSIGVHLSICRVVLNVTEDKATGHLSV